VDNVFIDTNLLVYTVDKGNPAKAIRASRVIDAVVRTASPVISTQVLQEFYYASTKKLGIDKLIARGIVHNLQNMTVIQVTPHLIERGIDISIDARTSFWDGLIIAAAEAAECSTLLSEDLSDGQVIRGIKIVNPFVHPGLNLWG